jgi:hypothetical protein
MIKKIALVTIFALASAFSLSTATAVTGNQSATKKINAPTAPAPQGFACGRGC